MPVACVYMLVFPNDKVYVGSAKCLPARIRGHRKAFQRGVDTALYRAWKKYGEPTRQVLDVTSDPSDLRDLEQWWLDALRPFARDGRGYNESTNAFRPDDTILSAIRKGKKHTAEAKAKMAAASRGQVRSRETREKIGRASLGRRHSPEARAKMSRAATGRSPSPEARAKIAATLSRLLKGRKLLPETREKISASLKAGYARERAARQ